MQTLQKYTREYLFEKFRDYHLQQRPASRPSLPHHVPQVQHMAPISRPILAIDTAPHPVMNRHPSLTAPRDFPSSDIRAGPTTRPIPDAISATRVPPPSKHFTIALLTVLTTSCVQGLLSHAQKKSLSHATFVDVGVCTIPTLAPADNSLIQQGS